MGPYILVLFLFFLVFGVFANCPKNVYCKSTLDKNSCPEGYFYRENVKSNFCCPGCVKLLQKGKRCTQSKDCAPGLACIQFPVLGKRCADDPEQSCEYYKNNDPYWTVEEYWKPDCLPDGEYGPKQCKGGRLSGKCFCTNGKGKRIFGESEWLKAGNMTCACSRLVDNLKQTNRGLSLHCDDNGNFEELQCDDSVCWCSNERTGIPYTPVVPESMMGALPCYDKRNFGSQYLRQCESVIVQMNRVVKLLKDHGTEYSIFPDVNCNSDGSYARVQPSGLKKYCTYKNKQRLTDASAGYTDCNCAYDKFVTEKLKKKNFNFECEMCGTYKTPQILGDKVFHVDSDGFPFLFEDVPVS